MGGLLLYVVQVKDSCDTMSSGGRRVSACTLLLKEYQVVSECVLLKLENFGARVFGSITNVDCCFRDFDEELLMRHHCE